LIESGYRENSVLELSNSGNAFFQGAVIVFLRHPAFMQIILDSDVMAYNLAGQSRINMLIEMTS
jgi:hypothetical protein